jgi:signal transduction histidine kinase
MLGSGLLLMLIIALGAAASSLDVGRLNRQSLHLQQYLNVLYRLQLATLQMETGQRGYFLTGDEAYLDSYAVGRKTIATELDALAAVDPAALGLVPPEPPIFQVFAQKRAELEQTLTLRRESGLPAALRVVETGTGHDLMKTLRDELDGMSQQAGTLVSRQQALVELENLLTLVLIIAGLLGSGGLATASVALLRREIVLHQAAAAALETRRNELARSNSELEQFAHLASHDLQEPLRTISSYTQLLRRRYAGKLDAKADQFIDHAVNGTKRMQALINDLLHYSRITTGARPLEPVDLESALDDTLMDLEIRIEDSGAVVTHDTLPTIAADPIQIRRLLLNLIGNGIKFHAPARTPVISIAAARDGAQWRFDVRDNGIGIEPQYIKQLFQVFKRLHSADEYPGTGIGLAVCRKIVERHGGRIWIESVLGEGSSFIFTLPAMETQS